jgi:hypothetical protein
MRRSGVSRVASTEDRRRAAIGLAPGAFTGIDTCGEPGEVEIAPDGTAGRGRL